MRKLFYVRTNGYDMVVSVDSDGDCRYMIENEYFPILAEDPEERAKEFLNSIEDDSSWQDDCTYSQIFEEFPVDILAEVEKEL